jgi:dUTP pyrophosphatase
VQNISIRFKKLEHFNGNLPAYQSAGAAGMDISACLKGAITLAPGERKLIPTGLSVEIPAGLEMQVRPRSGLALKKGLTVLNSPGTIDSDYRGEIGVILINLGAEDFTISHGERIAQLVVAPVVQPVVLSVTELTETVRGAGGFGSTGVQSSRVDSISP